jgi:hypothetical protein
MSINKPWSEINVDDLLRIDTFGQEIFIKESNKNPQPIFSNTEEFFTAIYSNPPEDKKIKVTYHNMEQETNVDLITWINSTVKKTINSLVVFITGYAGCGKSTFVQKTLAQLTGNYNFSYRYYNYDIGAQFEKSKDNRIKLLVLDCFIERIIEIMMSSEKKAVLEKYKLLLRKKTIRYLDNSLDIRYSFIETKAFAEAEKILSAPSKVSDNIDAAGVLLHEQLKEFDLNKILAIDCILRIAEYLCGNQNSSNIYICYDNMDSIEDFDALKKFDKTLVALRQNIDEYIMHSDDIYNDIAQPRFVFFVTYRKITAARVDLIEYSERRIDYPEHNRYIQYIDISHMYDYTEIVKKRVDYFIKYFSVKSIERFIELKNSLDLAHQLTQMDFMKNRFAGLWNNNYRTCSTILHQLILAYPTQLKECINMKNDGFNPRIYSHYGASAVFLNLICKVFKNNGLWNENRMNLAQLGVVYEGINTFKGVTLSRMILTFIANSRDDNNHMRPVSIKEIFMEFADFYSDKEICECLAGMLARNEQDTWRRPLYYYRNAIMPTENIFKALKKQCAKHHTGNDINYKYTEFQICECGMIFIEKIVSEYEFFSTRLNVDNKSLYLITEKEEMERITNDVFHAVGCCCQNMDEFRIQYSTKKNIRNINNFLDKKINPRTSNRNKPQLHTERIVFSHIAYMNYCRLYYFNLERKNENEEWINTLLVDKILDYLTLYKTYILPVTAHRVEVVNQLFEIAMRVKTAKTSNDRQLSIELPKI